MVPSQWQQPSGDNMKAAMDPEVAGNRGCEEIKQQQPDPQLTPTVIACITRWQVRGPRDANLCHSLRFGAAMLIDTRWEWDRRRGIAWVHAISRAGCHILVVCSLLK